MTPEFMTILATEHADEGFAILLAVNNDTFAIQDGTGGEPVV